LRNGKNWRRKQVSENFSPFYSFQKRERENSRKKKSGEEKKKSSSRDQLHNVTRISAVKRGNYAWGKLLKLEVPMKLLMGSDSVKIVRGLSQNPWKGNTALKQQG